MRVSEKTKVLYTIKGKKFRSLDGIPLHELKNHAEWIHPNLRAKCGLTFDDIDWMDAIAREREFEKIKDLLEDGKPVTEKQLKFFFEWS